MELTVTRRDSIDRTLGAAAAIVAALQLLVHARTFLDTLRQDPVWGPLFGLVGALVLLTVVVTFLWPITWLRPLWAGLALLGAALRWAWEFTGHTLQEDPWIYFMQPTFVAYAAAVWSLRVALGYTVVMVAAPALLAWVGWAQVAPDVVADATRQLLSVSFVIGLHLARYQLVAASAASQAVLSARTVAAQAEAALAERERVVGVIHDEVVASLLSIAHDPDGEQVRLEAAAAIAVVTRELGDERIADEVVDLAEAVPALTAEIFPRAPVDVVGAPSLVPGEVAQALLGALREALRNVARHAGPGGADTVRVRLSGDDTVLITVVDQGVGFRPEDVDQRRLGLREGVHGRLRSLPAGRATVESAPGRGTVVTLQWSR